MNTNFKTSRAALKHARERARIAKISGQVYSECFDLPGGPLWVSHAPAVGGGQLFGVWVYHYIEGRKRPLKL